MTMFQCKNLSISRQSKAILSNINITLERGSYLKIIGPNGIGKSTLLQTLASILPFSKNQIFFNEIDAHEALEEYRMLLCFIGDKLTLDLADSVFENLLFWARLNQREETVMAVISALKLHGCLDSKVSFLSTGFQKRVHLAKLLLSNAILWLLDEPFANLDAESIELLCNIMEIKRKQGGIIIFASHDIHHIKDNVEVLNLSQPLL